MINFACRRFDLKEIIRCGFNLTKTEFEIMLYLMKNSNKEFTSKEISKNLKIGLSTSQKSINNLNKKKLIKRQQKNFSKGGYAFVYLIKDKSHLKKKIIDTTNTLIREIEEEVSKL